jgi:hypothetical protein
MFSIRAGAENPRQAFAGVRAFAGSGLLPGPWLSGVRRTGRWRMGYGLQCGTRLTRVLFIARPLRWGRGARYGLPVWGEHPPMRTPLHGWA